MRNTMAVIALLWAIALSVVSLILPPKGVIDSSVLILVAQIVIFIATLIGIALPASFTNLIKNNGNPDSKKVAS